MAMVMYLVLVGLRDYHNLCIETIHEYDSRPPDYSNTGTFIADSY